MSCEYCDVFPKPLMDEVIRVTVDDEGKMFVEDIDGYCEFFKIEFCPKCGRRLGDSE